MSTGEASDLEWEERKKQARLANLVKAREAAKNKREQLAFTLEPVPEVIEVVNKKVIKPQSVIKHVPVIKKRKHESVKRVEILPRLEVQGESVSTRILSHMGGFLLTLLSVTASAVIPTLISAYRDQLTLPSYNNDHKVQHQPTPKRRDDLFDDQSIFL